MDVRSLTLQLLLFGCAILLDVFPNLPAQIHGDIEAEIPFSFIVADTTLRPGSYVIHPLGGDDPAMEVRSADGKEMVTVLITRAVSASLPARTELVFNRFEDQEFLSKILVEGNQEKAEIEPSRAESELKRAGQRPQVHVLPAKYLRPKVDPS